MISKILTDLSMESNWSFFNGSIYYPYAWAEEALELTDDNANELKEL